MSKLKVGDLVCFQQTFASKLLCRTLHCDKKHFCNNTVLEVAELYMGTFSGLYYMTFDVVQGCEIHVPAKYVTLIG